ncbi:fungal hydrophobin [Coprinellus micaceus]|uniref:Hydrophobin n=1 Tax=Coprinellus micaceus TaxID=71717 RepID=A0A4Y7SMP6_COPMI|nr:fungal hydrophobin [Coprinellus micaceus]
MQFKTLAATLSPFAVTFVAATGGTPAPHSPPRNATPGPIQCCNSTQATDSLDSHHPEPPRVLGIAVGSIDALVGLTCSPISIIGLPGNSCSAQPVCCTNNTFSMITRSAFCLGYF